VFSFDRRVGVRLPSGLVISHPPLSALPGGVLGTLAGPGSTIDTAQIREIKTPVRVTLWIVPSSTGMCIAVVSSQPGTAADCTGSPAAAEHHGVGLSADDASGATGYGIVPKGTHNVPLRTGEHTYRIVHPSDGIYVAHTPFQFG
jgi:hypothetical protein